MKRSKKYSGMIYPNIADWLHEHNMSVYKFAHKLGAEPSVAGKWMYGKTNPGKVYIDAILTLTGMTYEVAFSEKEVGV